MLLLEGGDLTSDSAGPVGCDCHDQPDGHWQSPESGVQGLAEPATGLHKPMASFSNKRHVHQLLNRRSNA